MFYFFTQRDKSFIVHIEKLSYLFLINIQNGNNTITISKRKFVF